MTHPEIDRLIITTLTPEKLIEVNKWYRMDVDMWYLQIRKYYNFVGDITKLSNPYQFFKLLV